VGGPNSDEGTESLVLYVYYNPFTAAAMAAVKTPANGAEEATGVVAAAAYSAAMPEEAATDSTNPPLSLHTKLPVHSNFFKPYLIS
jgi:hypothetical protein